MSGKTSRALTAGEKFFLHSGKLGARGQVAEGYAFVLFECLPLLKRMLAAKEKNAELKTLGYIMSSIWDSNAYKRGGTEGVLFVRQSGKSLFEDFSEEKAESLNAEFIRRNLSPGGAADTLALTLFLEKITCNRLL